jgi:L-alanine-DL-glutamate epimerase-like enolase superfamily enzyme
MKITRVALSPVHVARQYRTLTATLHGQPAATGGGIARSHFIILTVTTDNDLVGCGEISDIPRSTWPELPELQALLEQRLLGANPFDLEVLTRPLPLRLDVRVDGTTYDILAAGIDCALQDLCGKHVGVPACQLNGGVHRPQVLLSWVAFIRGLEELEAEMAEQVNRGFRAFKLKVGLDARLDEERLRVMRQIAGDGAHIKLDANSGWSTGAAIDNLRRLARWRPDGIETPVPYLDIAGKAEVRRRTGVPVIEHVNDLAFGLSLLRAEAVDVFNIATTGAGGIWRARKIMVLAESAGLPCLLGSTAELGIGTAAQLHLAASSPAVTWPSDLVGQFLYKDDVITRPFDFVDGCLTVPDGPGLGITLDWARIASLSEAGSPA